MEDFTGIERVGGGGWAKRPRSLSAFRFGFGLINSYESIYDKIFIRIADMLANGYTLNVFLETHTK